MSHYTVLQTRITDAETLMEALADVGFANVEIYNAPQPLVVREPAHGDPTKVVDPWRDRGPSIAPTAPRSRIAPVGSARIGGPGVDARVLPLRGQFFDRFIRHRVLPDLPDRQFTSENLAGAFERPAGH